jgi:hypothetical protein
MLIRFGLSHFGLFSDVNFGILMFGLAIMNKRLVLMGVGGMEDAANTRDEDEKKLLLLL